MKQQCKHQFFEIRKVSKPSESRREWNRRIKEDYFARLKASPNDTLLGPFLMGDDVFGVRVKCALCELQKDIYEEKE